MNRKGLDYAVSMMFIVIIVLPFLFVQLQTKTVETNTRIGESQAVMLRAPYLKEDVITYLQKSAELSLPDILSMCSTSITKKFNQEINKYIDTYNTKSPVTKIPKDNYELYIEGKNIHAIAILPVQQGLHERGMTYTAIGTLWFAPSFTVSTNTDLSNCIV